MPAVYRLSADVVCRQTNTDLQMLFDRRKGVMYELNETASAIVGQLAEGSMTSARIIAALHAEFDAPTEEIESDVERLLADFTDAGLLVRETNGDASDQS